MGILVIIGSRKSKWCLISIDKWFSRIDLRLLFLQESRKNKLNRLFREVCSLNNRNLILSYRKLMKRMRKLKSRKFSWISSWLNLDWIKENLRIKRKEKWKIFRELRKRKEIEMRSLEKSLRRNRKILNLLLRKIIKLKRRMRGLKRSYRGLKNSLRLKSRAIKSKERR